MSATQRLPGSEPDPALRASMAAWQHAVLALDAIDPVTTELIRLRAARQHACDT